MTSQLNVFGDTISTCCTNPMTGWYRNGCCETDGNDTGVHTVCAVMTDEFLEFSKSMGNDLSTPMPQYNFPGLKAGDKWCLCAMRWQEALENGKAPKVDLAATHMRSLEFVEMDDLKRFAI
jgi:uncharacterized protein (DUF2237 family)